MRRNHLKDLADHPNLISGIYNYCDRWCERCPLTARCLLYATEQADPDLNDPEVRDITNEKFWRKLHDIFRDTAEMITEWAAEAGVDLESINVDDEMTGQKRAMAEAEQDHLSQVAHRYAKAVETWFAKELATEEEIYEDPSQESDLSIGKAAEVIRWYQFFIAVKLMRAISGINEVDEEQLDDGEALSFEIVSAPADEGEEIDCDAIIGRTSFMDANGSAKIALVGIDRSIGAWRALQISLPEESVTIKPMLIELDRLRRSTEERFPRARDFIRPGFDEVLSDFVS